MILVNKCKKLVWQYTDILFGGYSKSHFVLLIDPPERFTHVIIFVNTNIMRMCFETSLMFSTNNILWERLCIYIAADPSIDREPPIGDGSILLGIRNEGSPCKDEHHCVKFEFGKYILIFTVSNGSQTQNNSWFSCAMRRSFYIKFNTYIVVWVKGGETNNIYHD